jgi:hypothetical protein
VSSYPAFLEACAEVTFPIPEEYSAALTTVSFILSKVGNYIDLRQWYRCNYDIGGRTVSLPRQGLRYGISIHRDVNLFLATHSICKAVLQAASIRTERLQNDKFASQFKFQGIIITRLCKYSGVSNLYSTILYCYFFSFSFSTTFL